MSKIIFLKIKKYINLMHFKTKNILKNNHYQFTTLLNTTEVVTGYLPIYF